MRIFVDVNFGEADLARLEAARQNRVPETEWRAIADASPTIEDCERVSRDVSAILDVEETIEHRYTLEVSSPGLDRPLRGAADFRRFVGRLAKIVAAEPVDRQTHFEGRLAGVDGEAVVIETTSGRTARRDGRAEAPKRQSIPLSLVRRARLEVEF